MKRIAIALLIGLACAGLLAAQTTQAPQTLRGNLALIDGQIAIQNGDTVYYLPGLGRFSNFIEGFREGAAVTLEGYSYDSGAFNYPVPPSVPAESRKVFLTRKLTLGSRTYDNLNPRLDQNPQAPLQGRQHGRMNPGGEGRR
jgi:hypothetical protein